MPSPWLAYVPQHTTRDLLAHLPASPVGREQRFECVALFADVSGFTAMSEALGQSGRLGAEELTGILNSYFEPMIALIQSYGGIIAKFGGDAVTVLFPYTRRRQAAVVRRALQCAVEMQSRMGRYESIPTSAGAFNLAMKAGLALGPVLCTTVGDPDIRLEAIVAGAVLDRCADAEHHAGKGEVVVHNALLEHAGPLATVEARGDFTCVARLRRKARLARVPPPPEVPPAAVPLLARYIHPSIAQRVAGGLTGFINEHRKVTVLFVSFSGFDYESDPNVSARLQDYLAAVIHVVQQYDGYVNKVDMGDKGSKAIVLFGTPVAHENDEERALRCALELLAVPGASARIGVNAGQAYCGEVGSEARKEYTVIGDAVNLAARLMQAAPPGQILASEPVQRATARVIQWQTLPAISVKGKREPVEVFQPLGVLETGASALQEQRYSLPMVGRERELSQAVEALEKARRGHGQILALAAEAGLGKSRLSAEIVREALRRGFTGFGGASQSFGTNIAYLAWRDVWRGFFGVEAEAAPESQGRQLSERLRALDARLADRLPLLGVALNLPLPENDLTRPLDAQLRAELLQSLLLECLRRYTRPARGPRRPVLLVLEDCHWLDPLSQDLLEFLGRNLADLPVMLLVLYRPSSDEGGPLGWASELEHVRILTLSELSAAEAETLMRLKLEQISGSSAELPREVMARLNDRAQGNPFYVEELMNYIRDRGLDLRDAHALAALDLPDSLHSLIISRIDQLTEAAKTSLKVASVIGRVFKANWLWGSYPLLGPAEAVREQLGQLSRVDLTPLNTPEPELEYIFKHITTQEVAYESLAFATRAALHEAVGNFIEQQYPDQLSQYVDVLAFHFGRSANAAKQRLYFRRAGDAAKASYANEAAEDYYQRLLALLPPEEQPAVQLELGEIWQLTGRWPEAEGVYRQALAYADAHDQAMVLARAQMALGSLLARTESFAEALNWYARAQAGFERLGDRRGAGRVLEQMSFAHFNLGDFEQARQDAEGQLVIATEHNDAVGLSGALDYRGIALLQLGRRDEAQASLRQAVEAAVRAGYRRGAAIAYNDLAGSYWMQDDYAGALEHLLSALDIAHGIGYLQMLGTMLGNAGSIYRQAGELDRALTCFSQALRISAELGDQPGIATHLHNLALVFFWMDDYEKVGRLCGRAADLGRALNLPQIHGDALYFQAYAELLSGGAQRARSLIRQALELRSAGSENEEALFLARVLDLECGLAVKEIASDEAARQLQTMLAASERPEQRARLHYARWRLDPQRDEDRRSAAELYRGLYSDTADVEYRTRYQALTGERLPPPPALPPVPEAVLQTTVDLNSLLRRVGVEWPDDT
jgi:class 3 adenylate cyclase/predicted ATPase